MLINNGEISIQEMAVRSGLTDHTLRYYERVGLIPSVGREAGTRRRRYSPEVADSIEVLACLRASGLGIKEMREYVYQHGSENAAATRKELFMKRQQDLLAEIEGLKLKYEYAKAKVAYHTAAERGDTSEMERAMTQVKAITARMRQNDGRAS